MAEPFVICANRERFSELYVVKDRSTGEVLGSVVRDQGDWRALDQEGVHVSFHRRRDEAARGVWQWAKLRKEVPRA